jgi:hypothetical protein
LKGNEISQTHNYHSLSTNTTTRIPTPSNNNNIIPNNFTKAQDLLVDRFPIEIKKNTNGKDKP